MKKLSLLLILLLFLGGVFQNCSPPSIRNSASTGAGSDLNSSLQLTEGGGHGSGYDGKIYLSPGTCADGKTNRHEIRISKDKKLVQLTRWNCREVNPPELLKSEDLIYSNSDQTEFKYADAPFYLKEVFEASQVASCMDIKSKNPTSTSGDYLIDLDGLGGQKPFSVHCNMQTDGGGWTVIVGAHAVNASKLLVCEGKGPSPGRCDISESRTQMILENSLEAEVLLHLNLKNVREVMATGFTNVAGWSGVAGITLLDEDQKRIDDVPCVWGFYCTFDQFTNFQSFNSLKAVAPGQTR